MTGLVILTLPLNTIGLHIMSNFKDLLVPSSSWEGENLENRIAYMTFVRDFLVVVDSHKYQNPDNYIGRRVAKKQKPFKSGNKENTIKGIVNPPTLNVPCFTFEEDESYVECSRCKIVSNSL